MDVQTMDQPVALALGLDCLASVGVKSQAKRVPALSKFRAALSDFPEARAEICLSMLSVLAEHATSVDEIQRAVHGYAAILDQVHA